MSSVPGKVPKFIRPNIPPRPPGPPGPGWAETAVANNSTNPHVPRLRRNMIHNLSLLCMCN